MTGTEGERDATGFAPIGSYGVLGDGRGVALVARDGSIDWLAAPGLDSTPPFAALLDPAHGGRIELRPSVPFTLERRYLTDTNILESVYTTAQGRVRVTDSLNSGVAGRLPWSELARRVDGLAGAVEMSWSVTPGTGLGQVSPWAEQDGRGVFLHVGELALALRTDGLGEPDVSSAAVSGRATVSAGRRGVLAVVAGQDQPLLLPTVAAIDARVDLSVESWRRWAEQIRFSGARRGQIVRNALAIKLILQSSTGAIAAAATTSLPERVGGDKNWDYRYCWIRDTALTIDALTECGLQEEVQAAVAWLLAAVRRNGPDLHVLYRLDGSVCPQMEAADVPGYRGSRPVRVGNDAAGQRQLGLYGHVIGTMAGWADAGHVIDVGTARQVRELADRCADTWRRADAGVWELQTDRQYTASKIGAWRALDRAAALADGGYIDGTGARWRQEADRIRAWVEEHCWSAERQAYTFYAGTDDLDASVLLGARHGFDVGARMSSTIDALRAELGCGRSGGPELLYRYSGVSAEEGAFIACSYWLVEALARTGRRVEAEAVMAGLDAVASPLGLLSEMVDPESGELLGNIPQALSHLSLINAACALESPG